MRPQEPSSHPASQANLKQLIDRECVCISSLGLAVYGQCEKTLWNNSLTQSDVIKKRRSTRMDENPTNENSTENPLGVGTVAIILVVRYKTNKTDAYMNDDIAEIQ